MCFTFYCRKYCKSIHEFQSKSSMFYVLAKLSLSHSLTLSLSHSLTLSLSLSLSLPWLGYGVEWSEGIILKKFCVKWCLGPVFQHSLTWEVLYISCYMFSQIQIENSISNALIASFVPSFEWHYYYYIISHICIQ